MNVRLVGGTDGYAESPRQSPRAAIGVGTGGNGPHDTGMESRVAKLEATIATLATKADIELLNTGFERAQKDNRTWMLATVIALFLGILALANFINTGLSKQLSAVGEAKAATVQPIVIQLPAPQQPVQADPKVAPKP